MKFDIPTNLLTPRSPRTHDDWTIWEKKNFNIHRGLIEISVPRVKSIHELAEQIRQGVREEFRPNWFRGFGFGTILRLREVPADFAEICQHIDTRNKQHGVWQWAIVVLEEDQVAIAVHTWLQGYLRPVYDAILVQLEQGGFQCHASDAEVDELIARLRRIADTVRMLQRVAGIAT
ncbi:MAG: hypothetical protein R3B90_00515 [Planctomycetaceae bacterium]